MGSTVQAEALNAMFSARLDTTEGKEKIAEYGTKMVRDRIREEGFAGKILPRQPITPDQCQVSVNSDTLVKIVETEPYSRAMSMSFRGQPEVNFYTSPRFEVGFHRVGSQRFEQSETDLQAYRIPITQIIKKHIANDIQEIEDRVFLGHVEAAVQSLQQDAQGLVFGAVYAAAAAFCAFNIVDPGTNIPELGKVKSIDCLQNSVAANAAAGVVEDILFPVQKDDFVKLGKLFPGRGGPRNGRLRVDKLLITDTDLLDVNTWTTSDVGDEIAGQTTVHGWKKSTIVGMKYVRTLKTDILRPGNIYAFTTADFLGGFLVLNKTKFYADKERDMISFEAWENIGMYIGNVAACRKLELFGGSVENITADPNAAYKLDFLPLQENELGQLNNLVEEGVTFPAIAQF